MGAGRGIGAGLEEVQLLGIERAKPLGTLGLGVRDVVVVAEVVVGVDAVVVGEAEARSGLSKHNQKPNEEMISLQHKTRGDCEMNEGERTRR